MEISSFSSLIEVGVTLNIACVAVEYVKSYTSVLCNQVFNLKSLIESSCKECVDSLTDETTIRNLPNANVNGANTEIVKERLISKRNTLISDIGKKEKELKEKIKEVCEVKNISSICLWLSLLGLIGLFMIGFEEQGKDANNSGIHFYWTAATLFSLIFTVVGWVSGNNDKPLCRYIDYRSLRFSIFTFIVCTLLSITAYFCTSLPEVVISEEWWKVILICSVILIYSNFFASSIEVWNKAQKGKSDIIDAKQTLMKRCEELNDTVNSFQGLKTVAAILTMDTAEE